MTSDDVVRLAREAGFRTGTYTLPLPHGLAFVEPVGNGCLVEMERFARLVEKATAEKCAALCIEQGTTTNGIYERNQTCADVIRVAFPVG